ncbi:hypothetical protein QQ045_026092 [Rhodiola kirilowii]
MGRSRAVSHAADEDSSQSRSKRKRNASNMENLENASTGSGVGDGKGALYHCNYCNKDISGKIRIKCAVCPDFDLCVECFSVGAEVTPHKSGHPYRVMDNLSFPLICPDWNADEEILLLEGIEMYGLGNWTEVAEHVGTKKKSECIDHYNTVYMNSPCFPLPDLSHVMGKSREELLAMAKEHSDLNKGTLGEVKKEESPFTAGIKIEDSRKEGPPGHSSPAFSGGVGSSGGKASMVAAKRASNITQNKNGRENAKAESRLERTTGEKKLKLSNDETPPVTEVNGYNFKRQEFEVEYDNDAEQLLADMEFKDTDTAAEKELKLRILHIYSKRLDERKRRKEFILERGLLYPDPYEKTLSPEEKEIYNKYKVFMRFLPKEEYEDMVKTAIEEHRILKRIQELQEARAAGCRTSSEARRYIEQKRKEAEESARKMKESFQPGPGGKALMRANHTKGEFDSSGPRGSVVLESGGLCSPNVGQSLANSLDVWDVTGFPGADLLSDAEKQLCCEIRILPAHYLSMMQTISMGMLNGSITQKSDAYPLFKVDPSKVDRVYDELLKKGFTPQ